MVNTSFTSEKSQMTRERKILLSSIVIAVVGWLTAAVLILSVGTLKQRAVSAEEDAEIFKRQAGKAYTELLKARAGADSTTALIPAGTRIECIMRTNVDDGNTVTKCEDGTIYPPLDY